PGLATPAPYHGNKLAYPLLGRLLPLSQPAIGFQLIRRKNLAQGGQEKATPAMPAIAGDCAAEELGILKSSAKGGFRNDGSRRVGRRFWAGRRVVGVSSGPAPPAPGLLR